MASRTHASQSYCSAPAQRAGASVSRCQGCIVPAKQARIIVLHEHILFALLLPFRSARLHAACQQHASARPLFHACWTKFSDQTHTVKPWSIPAAPQKGPPGLPCTPLRCAELSCRRPFFHIHHPLNTSQCLLANQTLCTSLLSMTGETSRNIRSIPAAQKGPPALPCVPLCCACQQQRSLSSTSVVHTTMSPGVLWLLLSWPFMELPGEDTLGVSARLPSLCMHSKHPAKGSTATSAVDRLSCGGLLL